MQKRIDFPYWAAVSICLCALLLLFRFFALPLLSAALPFLLSAALVSLLSPLAEKLAKRLHWNKGACAVVLFLLLLGTSLVLGGLALATLLREGRELLSDLLADLGSPSSLLSDAVDALHLPDNSESELFRAQLKTALTGFAEKGLGEIATQLPGLAAKIAAGVPSVILFAVITVFSGIQFSIGGAQMWKKIICLLPKAWQDVVGNRREKVQPFFQQYLRAHLLLFLIAFAVLLVGFLVLGLQYAFLASLLVALVDLLPFLGVGTVLLPWAVLELLCHNYFLGFGLLILCLIATVARQIAEPHLIGKTLGIPPLLSLAAGYAGWKLAGVLGLFAGPLLLPILREIVGFFIPGQTEKARGK